MRVVFSWRAAKEWADSTSASVSIENGEEVRWEPAKPVGVPLWSRVKGALVVLRGDGFVVRWY